MMEEEKRTCEVAPLEKMAKEDLALQSASDGDRCAELDAMVHPLALVNIMAIFFCPQFAEFTRLHGPRLEDELLL